VTGYNQSCAAAKFARLLLTACLGLVLAAARPFGFAGIAGSTAGVSNLIIVAFCVVVAGQVVLSLTPFGTARPATRCRRSPP
jgi:hypothetical protein